MIENPNSSGQGFDRDYVVSPWTGLILAFGFRYSHSTPIGGAAPFISHTFERGERRISVDARGLKSFRWGSKTSCASGASRTGFRLSSLARHLVRITPSGQED